MPALSAELQCLLYMYVMALETFVGIIWRLGLGCKRKPFVRDCLTLGQPIGMT